MSTITPLQSQDDPRQRVAAEIRALMGRHGITQIALAAALDMGQSQLSKRLKGRIPFDIDEISTIAGVFGVSVGSLFGEASYPRPGPRGPDEGLGADDETRTRNFLLGIPRLQSVPFPLAAAA